METSFVEWLGTGNGIAVSCLVGLLVVLGIVWFVHWRTAFRAWEGDEANALLGLGVPAWFAAPLLKASQGNVAGTLSALKTFGTNVTSAAGLAELDAGYLTKAKADPTRWARIMTVINDVNGGASAAQIQTDIQSAVAQSPLAQLTPPPTALSVLKSDASNVLSNFTAGMAGIAANPAFAPIVTALHAAGLDNLIPAINSAIQAHASLAGAPAAVADTPSPSNAGPDPAAASAQLPVTMPIPSGAVVTVQHP